MGLYPVKFKFTLKRKLFNELFKIEPLETELAP